MPRLAPPAKSSTRTPSSAVPNQLGTRLGDALDRWYVHLNASDRIGSPRTIQSYRYGTAKLIDHVGSSRSLDTVSTEDLEALFASLKQGGLAPGARAAVYRPV